MIETKTAAPTFDEPHSVCALARLRSHGGGSARDRTITTGRCRALRILDERRAAQSAALALGFAAAPVPFALSLFRLTETSIETPGSFIVTP